jgi:DNA polymerase III alpha subunit (gram-positive type)
MKYDKILFFDLETTGLDFKRDRIIEFGGVVYDFTTNEVIEKHSFFINAGKQIPKNIEKLTGISNTAIIESGVSEQVLFDTVSKYFTSNTLLVAYNIHFDINFMYELLKRFKLKIKNPNLLDMLTVYRENHEFPHKLANAIEKYNIPVKPTHRSLDDTEAMVILFEKMKSEFDDIFNFIDILCYVERYGISGSKFNHVRYVPFNFKKNTVSKFLNQKM